MGSEPPVEIGEFSARVGVSPEVLRKWERRYGIPRPARTTNGRRVFSRDDERFVLAMRRALARGLRPAQAADAAMADAGDTSGSAELDAVREQLRAALDALDGARADRALDHLFAAYDVDVALSRVVLPYLHELGERWTCAEVGIGDEHFASNLLAGRLLALARGWDEGAGPRALLACPSGELHTIGLLSFGLALRRHGWRITYLGADTPTHALVSAATAVSPDRIVLAATRADVFAHARDELAALAARVPVALAGAGAVSAIVADTDLRLLERDPVAEASHLSRVRPLG